jgi:hypothetical protein
MVKNSKTGLYDILKRDGAQHGSFNMREQVTKGSVSIPLYEDRSKGVSEPTK